MPELPKAGFSLGWVFDTSPADVTLVSILNFLYYKGVDAVEFCFNLTRLRHFSLFLTEELIKRIERFDYVSLHLPDIIGEADDELTIEVIKRAVSLKRRFRVDMVVIHPDSVKDWDSLENLARESLLPVAIEFPMNKNKEKGRKLEELRAVCERYFHFNYVLDVQHAYENDKSGELAICSARLMGSRLAHLHVSGQTQSSSHSYLFRADNRAEIKRVIKDPSLSGVLRISEGEFKCCDYQVAKELKCLKEKQ
ncbi:MAG: hypothetical protein PHI53_00555 [Candidatus Pacebacteria bacterium]|nr:hypothetical protein [Candidatus Paceibacterota bacterium]